MTITYYVQGKYECVATNSVGTEYSYAAQLYVRVRRVPPHFTIRPDAKYEVKNGAALNITCVAVGSPMPFVKVGFITISKWGSFGRPSRAFFWLKAAIPPPSH